MSLRAPLRSWGALSIGDDRWTERYPTASAVLGLAAACVGIERSDGARLACWFGAWDVVSLSAEAWQAGGPTQDRRNAGDRPLVPGLRPDYQTAHDSLKMDGSTNDEAVVSLRGYIEQAHEAAALVLREGASAELVDVAVAALRAPAFTPYLGRRACPLQEPLLVPQLHTVDGSADEVAQALERVLDTPGLMSNAAVRWKSATLVAPVGLLDEAPRRRKLHTEPVPDERLGARAIYATRLTQRFQVTANDGATTA